ncbi:MAG TPA: hypothetical protein VJR89_25370 [Polyangiales bacterium]|nr:hypothetical protein [Polyangiales bacterium]
MKSNLIVAWVVACALCAGCEFDRRPLSSGSSAQRVPDAGATAADATTGEAHEAGVPTFDASTGQPQDAAVADASLTVDAARPRDPTHDEDDAGRAEQPEKPPVTGGLTCGGTDCPFGVDPEKPCCTTAEDVSQRTARTADRCGLDLSALPGGYGKRCWQRDQLGILDERCPNLPAAGGGGEPGCCSDTGQCGTFNGDHKLGCRYASGAAPRACAEQPVENTCDPVGNFGARISVDAAWGGRSGGLWELTDDGRGKIEVYLLFQVQGVNSMTRRLEGKARVCGVTLPPFMSTILCEAYQPIFPTRIWESNKLRPLPLLGSYECAANGCVLSLDAQTYLLGFDMNNAEAPWPDPGTNNQLRCPAGNGLRCYPDHDGDDEPGVRVELPSGGYVMGGTGCRSRYERRSPPLSSSVAAIFDGVRRTDRLELGIRTKLGGTARLADDCNTARGSGLAEYVNSRAAGCWVEPGTQNIGGSPAGPNDPCQRNETTFLDENLPVYMLLAAGETPDSDLELSDTRPSRGPEVSVVRLKPGAAVRCEDVRNAKY